MHHKFRTWSGASVQRPLDAMTSLHTLGDPAGAITAAVIRAVVLKKEDRTNTAIQDF